MQVAMVNDCPLDSVKIGNASFLVTPEGKSIPPIDTYRDFTYLLNQLSVSAASQDISKLDFNILEMPDLHSLDAPNHTQVRGEPGGGKSVLIARKLLEERSQTPSHLKIGVAQ